MSMFARRPAQRSISYQDVWGHGADWTETGSGYSAAQAFAISAVQGCLALRSGLIGQLPMQSLRTVNGLDVPSLTQPPVIGKPSSVVVTSVWLVQMQISRDLWGNAFGYVASWDGAGFPRFIEWLDPTKVRASQAVYSGAVDVSFDGTPLDRSRVVIVPGRYVMPGSPLGVAPLEATGLVEVAKLAKEFGRDWFRNGSVPSTVVYVDRELNATQADEIADRISAKWRKRKPAVVGTAISKIEYPEIKPNESQFLETQAQVGREICQSFSCNPQWVGLPSPGSSITYANVTTEKQAKLDSMNLDLRIVEDVLSDPSVTPRGQFVKFNTGAYLQSDLMGRYESYKIAAEIQAATGEPLLTTDEMRQLENRAPLPPRAPAPVATAQP